jgi:hypothetical protein
MGSTAEYFYYIRTINDQQITSKLPYNAPFEYYSFFASQDSTTSIFTHDEPVPWIFTLSQNYPNPFNPQTTIEFSIPNESEIELVVFNLLGQNVFQKNMTKVNAGSHKIIFDGNGLSSGIYFYSLKVKEGTRKIFKQTKKMLYIQ